jgi:hypothetical protein
VDVESTKCSIRTTTGLAICWFIIKKAWDTRSICEQKRLSRFLYTWILVRQTKWKIGDGISAWQLGIFVSEDTQRLFIEVRCVLEMCSKRCRSSPVWSLCKQRNFDLNLRWNPLQLLFFQFMTVRCIAKYNQSYLTQQDFRKVCGVKVLLVYYYRLLQKNFSFLSEVQLFIN